MRQPKSNAALSHHCQCLRRTVHTLVCSNAFVVAPGCLLLGDEATTDIKRTLEIVRMYKIECPRKANDFLPILPPLSESGGTHAERFHFHSGPLTDFLK